MEQVRNGGVAKKRDMVYEMICIGTRDKIYDENQNLCPSLGS